MPGYSKMDLMRMSDDDLQKILKEEGESLPGYTISMIVEELKARMEMEKYSDNISETNLEEPEIDEMEKEDVPEENKRNSTGEDRNNVEESLEKQNGSSNIPSDADMDSLTGNSLDDAAPENDESDDDMNDEDDLTEEEKLQKEIKQLEEQQKERTKTLIVASIAAGVVLLAAVGLIVYLYLSGQLQ